MHLSAKRRNSVALRYATIYIFFLLVCLTLGFFFYMSVTDNAQKNYWSHHAAQLSVDVSITDSDLATIENFARQLSTDSTFVRLTNMTGLDSPGFVFTAYNVMQSLSVRQYALFSLPVDAHIYLPESDYVISASQFSEADPFYRYYLTYPPQLQQQWYAMLLENGKGVSCRSLSPFDTATRDVILTYDIGKMLNARIPAVIWFRLDSVSVAKRFFSSLPPEAVLTIDNTDGSRLITLTPDGSAADESLLAAMAASGYDANGFAVSGDMQLIRCSGKNGWLYTLALPMSMSTEALGDYTPAFYLIFFMAILSGAALVFLLVRQSMRPLLDLHMRLVKAQGDNAEMQRTIDAQRPLLCMSYLKKLLSGHVSSEDEFSYMMDFLQLSGRLQHYVLFCHVNPQGDAQLSESDMYTLLQEKISDHLGDRYPVYHYSTLSRDYIILVSYDADAQDTLGDLQRRVSALHADLAQNYNLWFHAGAGDVCTQPHLLWESYEQARSAYRYAAKDSVFLPYSLIKKDADQWYYPVEISAKLQRFITTGNQQQAAELFSLIHRENLIERQLPVALLGYLLSDLKNTLVKARFQIDTAGREDMRAALAELDARLETASAFHEIEACAITLCGFFTSTAEPSDPIPDIKRYLQENFADPSLCLSKLSGIFNISESYLSHLFKTRTGENFSVYLEDLRMTEAERRLRDPGCNLSTLYEELGYSSAATWRRAFKKRFGITPSEMLKQNS
ncbi:MAG: helix-turn-helix domain-containing protein [Clostridia bacterium]|nr:helix-turn-helix domain-containing protein [Clostridia bacterium]